MSSVFIASLTRTGEQHVGLVIVDLSSTPYCCYEHITMHIHDTDHTFYLLDADLK